MEHIRIASWNTLNGSPARDYPSQEARLPELVQHTRELADSTTNFIMYVCEFGSRERLEQFADLSELSIIRRAFENGKHEWVAMLADNETAAQADAMHTGLTTNIRRGNLHCRIGDDVSITGMHCPRALFAGRKERRLSAQKAININQKQLRRFIVGDFNSLPWSFARLQLTQAGYRQAHDAGRLPLFPIASYRGRSVSEWTPPAPIDGIYAAGDVMRVQAGQVRSDASDHPLIWADYKLT